MLTFFLWRPEKEQIPRWGGNIKVHYMLTDYLDRSEHLQLIISSVSDPGSLNPGSGSRPFSESGSGSDPDRGFVRQECDEKIPILLIFLDQISHYSNKDVSFRLKEPLA